MSVRFSLKVNFYKHFSGPTKMSSSSKKQALSTLSTAELIQRLRKSLSKEKIAPKVANRVVAGLNPARKAAGPAAAGAAEQPAAVPAVPVPTHKFTLSRDLLIFGGAASKYILNVNPAILVTNLKPLFKHTAKIYPTILEEVTRLRVNPDTTTISIVFDVHCSRHHKEIERQDMPLHMNAIAMNRKLDFAAVSIELNDKINSIEAKPNENSGWKVDSVFSVSFTFTERRATSGKGYIKEPDFFKDYTDLFNVRNNDDLCFKYAITALKVANNPIYLEPYNVWTSQVKEIKEVRKQCMTYLTDPTWLSESLEFKEIKDTMLTYPIKVNENSTEITLSQFEEANQCRVRIIGLHVTNEARGLYDRSIIRRPSIPQTAVGIPTYDLILIRQITDSHFMAIREDGFERMMKVASQHKGYICDCGAVFQTEKQLDDHLKSHICTDEKNPIIFNYPPSDEKNAWRSTVEFKNFARSIPAPNIVIGDTETVQTPCEVKRKGISSIHEYDSHALIGLARDPTLNIPIIEREYKEGKRDGVVIINDLVEMAKRWASQRYDDPNEPDEDENGDKIPKNNRPVPPLNPEQEQEMDNAWRGINGCSVCGKQFKDTRDWKKKNHDYDPVPYYDLQNGHFVGPTHRRCYRTVQEDIEKKLNVYFHNGCGYDYHLIIPALGSCPNIKLVKPLMRSNEKSIQLEFQVNAPGHVADGWRIVLRDTLRHYGPGSSLKKLVEILAGYVKPDLSEDERKAWTKLNNFPVTTEYHRGKGRSDAIIEKYLLQKGLMCHDWLNSVSQSSPLWHNRPITREDRLNGGFPAYDAFESILIKEATTAEEPVFDKVGWAKLRYAEAKEVYDACGCQSFREYLALYSVNDVLLLADCFQFHRKMLYNLSVEIDGRQVKFGLDCAHYVGLPALAKDIMLKVTEAKLRTFTVDEAPIMDDLEPSIRGGNSFISLRKFITDETLPADYTAHIRNLFIDQCLAEGSMSTDDIEPGLPPVEEAEDALEAEELAEKKHRQAELGFVPRSTAWDLDANSLYPTAMCRALPIDQFKMETDPEFCASFLLNGYARILNMTDDDEYGADFVMSGYLPRHLHAKFNSYPILPHRAAVGESMLSAKYKELDAKTDQALHLRVAEECERNAVLHPEKSAFYLAQAARAREKATHATYIPTASHDVKLLSTLLPFDHYLAHWSLVKEAILRGYVITKIHKVITYRQGAFLKPLIEGIVKMRAAAKSKLEKDAFKLIMNSLYGKFLENARNYSVNKLVTNAEDFKRLAASPMYKDRFTVFGPDVAMMEFYKSECEFKQMIMIGQAILDISKVIMSQFFYGVLKPLFGDKVQVAFTDTDSLLCLFTDPRMVEISNDDLRNRFLYRLKSEDKAELVAEMTKRCAKSEAEANKKSIKMLAKIAEMKSNVSNELDEYRVQEAIFKHNAMMNKMMIEKEGVRMYFAIKKQFPEVDEFGKTFCDYLDMLDSKKLGLFKPDTGVGNRITGFIGLRAKVYNLRLEKRNLFTEEIEEHHEIRTKGINKDVAATLTWEEYERALNGDVIMKSMDRIQSIKHTIYSMTVNKIALSGNDDKRFIEADGIHTSAYGFGAPDPVMD